MLADKINTFRDSMNTAYGPAALLQQSQDANRNPAKEFERKTDFIETIDLAYSGGTENSRDINLTKPEDSNKIDILDQSRKKEKSILSEKRNENQVNEKRHSENEDNAVKRNGREHHENDGSTDESNTVRDGKNQANGTANGEGENDGKKTDASTASTASTAQDGQSKKAVKGKNTDGTAGKSEKVSDLKEYIKKNTLETAQEIDQVKAEAKENAAQSQKINAKTKDVVKNLETAKGENQTPDTRQSDELKNLEEASEEKKQASNAEAEKKSDKAAATFMDELKNVSKETKTENPQINTSHVDSKDAQHKVDLKIKKLLPQSNAEQYQAMKEKIVNSVENSIKFLVSEGEKQVSIKLHPPELGRVDVELVIKDNQVSAKITTENSAVKEVVMSNLDQLKSNIANAGITVNKFDVDVGGFKNQLDHQFSNGNSNGQGRGNRGDGSSNTGDGGLPREKDWLPDKVIMHRALNFFVGGSVNYLV